MSILADLDDKIDSVEEKLVKYMENAVALLKENFSNSIDRQTEERRKLKDLLEENERKQNEVNLNILKQNKKMSKDDSVFIYCIYSIINKQIRNPSCKLSLVYNCNNKWELLWWIPVFNLPE